MKVSCFMNVFYMGKEYPLSYKSYPGKEAKALLYENELVLYINPKWDDCKRQEEVALAIRRLLMREAESAISSRLSYYKSVIGVAYKDVRIKEQKTRWGSCSSKGNLNFNYRLIMAPLWILDYVVIHELCHLKHMNHSRDFWELVEVNFSKYKEAKQWLKDNGAKLKIEV